MKNIKIKDCQQETRETIQKEWNKIKAQTTLTKIQKINEEETKHIKE